MEQMGVFYSKRNTHPFSNLNGPGITRLHPHVYLTGR
jgi:hypothetical protein